MLKRKIYDELVAWKSSSNGTTAMMIDGARRVGKSYIAEAFAKAEYKSYILIDFGRAPTDVLDLFANDSSDLDLFFAKLAAFYATPLHRRESLIIFDEVQQYPRARQLIKYLVADGRFDYLETGSLIRLKKNVQDIIIPSEEDHIEMFPLDFEEFLRYDYDRRRGGWKALAFLQDKGLCIVLKQSNPLAQHFTGRS